MRACGININLIIFNSSPYLHYSRKIYSNILKLLCLSDYHFDTIENSSDFYLFTDINTTTGSVSLISANIFR